MRNNELIILLGDFLRVTRNFEISHDKLGLGLSNDVIFGRFQLSAWNLLRYYDADLHL